jgi:hypothetical protein
MPEENMKWILIFCTVATIALMVTHELDKKYQQGFADAKKTLLSLTPPSEALELACLSLWVTEQNKKYQEKDNAR